MTVRKPVSKSIAGNYLVLSLNTAGFLGVLVTIGLAIYGIYQNELHFDAENFNRKQSQTILAWHTIQEANGKKYEIGQSASVEFLFKN